MLSDCDDEDWHPDSEEVEVKFNIKDDGANSFSSVTNSPPGVATETDEGELINCNFSRFTRTRLWISMLTALFVVRRYFTRLITSPVCWTSIFEQSIGSIMMKMQKLWPRKG